MARALSRAVLLLMAPCWVYAAGFGGDAAKKVAALGVEIEVVVIKASGRGLKPDFDGRISAELRKKLAGCHLAYGKYALVDVQHKSARYKRKVICILPGKEALAIICTPHTSRTHPVRVATQVIDGAGKIIQRAQVLLPYNKAFLIHRPKGASAVIMGITAYKHPSKMPGR